MTKQGLCEYMIDHFEIMYGVRVYYVCYVCMYVTNVCVFLGFVH